MKNNIFIIAIALSLMLSSCGNTEDIQPSYKYEAINSGTFTAYCDDVIYDIMKPVLDMYDEAYPKINATITVASGRESMKQLLAGNTDAILLTRDYLHDEDSLMKVYKVKPYQRQNFAMDAVVLFARNDFPLDTLNHRQVAGALDGSLKLSDEFSALGAEPRIATHTYQSSIYANIRHLVLKGGKVSPNIKLFPTFAEINDYVLQDNNTIGVTYLSKVTKRKDIKLLQIGFVKDKNLGDSVVTRSLVTDSTGMYIRPKPVHQSYVLMSKYPYIVNYYIYLREDRRNLPFWFGQYLYKEGKTQKYFLDLGIVPVYAHIKLVEDE